MKQTFWAIIPARWQSSRFPGKPLAPLGEKTMVQRVWEQAIASEARHVYVATDDDRIYQHAASFGASVVMTKKNHQSGTDRIAEVVQQLSLKPDDVVVNVQGDEPMLPALLINQVACDLIAHPHASISTLCTPINDWDEWQNPNVVKVVSNQHGEAMYFSRAPIPWERDAHMRHKKQLNSSSPPSRHIGLYAYRVAFLNEYTRWNDCAIEHSESLEQLRALWHGCRIRVLTAKQVPSPGIDTPEDLKQLCDEQGWKLGEFEAR